MLKHHLALAALAIVLASPASSQTQSPTGTNVGALTCRTGPSIGLIFGSRQKMACRFVPNGPYPPEAYVGIMNSIGLDVGITAGGVMAMARNPRMFGKILTFMFVGMALAEGWAVIAWLVVGNH